jgi:uncharacterized linocin/CFP29 family protein
MNILKRKLAPIADEVWKELDERAVEVFKSYLSARKVVNVEGPKGLNYTVLPEGRLTNISKEKNGVNYGIYKVKPLIEARVEFEINRWELDNISRGAEDADLEPLENAVKEIALFEENAVYNGNENAQIKGIIESSSHDTINLGNSNSEIMEAISQGILKLKESYVETPYTLVVGPDVWTKFNKLSEEYPLTKKIEKLVGKEIVFSHAIKGAVLIPYNHSDLELVVGQDFALGYHSNDSEKIKFFIIESFTFRVLDPDIIIKFSL